MLNYRWCRPEFLLISTEIKNESVSGVKDILVAAVLYDASGNAQTVKVKDGYMASRVIPAQYSTVSRQVWVSGGGPRVGLGLGFRF